MAIEWDACVKYSVCWSVLLMWEVHFCTVNAADVPLEGSIRLMINDTQSEGQGRVEVMHAGQWGTICSTGWQNRDALVVCRQLGYERGIAVWSGIYGAGSGRIWLQNVGCSPLDEDILSCRSDPIGVHSCNHSQDVGVYCWQDEAFPWPMRLMNDDEESSSAGRVEVMFQDQWGSICEESYYRRDALAKVVCRQRGYDTGTAVAGWLHGKGSGPTWLHHVYCGGSDTDIFSCSLSAVYEDGLQCEADAAVYCWNYDNVPSLELRLMNGSEPSLSGAGRVEVRYNGVWGSVCADRFYSRVISSILCKAMGYTAGWHVAGGVYGASAQPVLLKYLVCVHDQQNLMDCVGDAAIGEAGCAGNQQDAAVFCYNDLSEMDFSHRLVYHGQVDNQKGRLEMLFNNEWGTACYLYPRFGWPDEVLLRICNARGYHAGKSVARGVYGLEPDNTNWTMYSGSGTYHHLIHYYRHDAIGNARCNGQPGIFCHQESYRIPLRLVDDDKVTESEGRVEVMFEGMWGVVCYDEYWGNTDALVVCRQLGYTDGEMVVERGKYDKPGRRTWLSQCMCGREHMHLLQCEYDMDIGGKQCQWQAAVKCLGEAAAATTARTLTHAATTSDQTTTEAADNTAHTQHATSAADNIQTTTASGDVKHTTDSKQTTHSATNKTRYTQSTNRLHTTTAKHRMQTTTSGDTTDRIQTSTARIISTEESDATTRSTDSDNDAPWWQCETMSCRIYIGAVIVVIIVTVIIVFIVCRHKLATRKLDLSKKPYVHGALQTDIYTWNSEKKPVT